MDHSLEHHQSYIGKAISALPTPSLILSLPVLQRNIDRLLQDVDELGILFRPHVKTLKTLEVTRMMLGGGRHKAIVASTLAEIQGVLPLAREGVLTECLYGLPVYPGCLGRLSEFRKLLDIVLMVDNEEQIRVLEDFAAATAAEQQPRRWDIFIKIDVGTHRAGLGPSSTALPSLLARAEASKAVRIRGFYCHAGHSYQGRTRVGAEAMLQMEISTLLGLVQLLPVARVIVLSVGSTPTAHVVRSWRRALPAHVRLELHAGNFPCNDLQQVATGLVVPEDQAMRVAADVCGVYPERDEALINAGVIALTREVSDFAGFGRVVGKPDWAVVRLSQEHGILAKSSNITSGRTVETEFEVGQRVHLWVNHACIVAAAFHVFYVVDDRDVVVGTMLPWKGW